MSEIKFLSKDEVKAAKAHRFQVYKNHSIQIGVDTLAAAEQYVSDDIARAQAAVSDEFGCDNYLIRMTDIEI